MWNAECGMSFHSSLRTPNSTFRIRNSRKSNCQRRGAASRRRPGRSLFLFAIISRLSSVKLVTPEGYSHAGRSALRHVQPRTSNPADLRSSASICVPFLPPVPAGTGFRSPEAEGTQRILIARGGSFAVLSPRWVMWQETPAAGIVNRSSLKNCAVQAVCISPRFPRPAAGDCCRRNRRHLRLHRSLRRRLPWHSPLPPQS
jgi:hypothetical protein